MKNAHVYKNKNILILGLAKSGFATAKLLNRIGARVTINDQKSLQEIEEVNELKSVGIRVICGGHPPELLHEKWDLIVKNPGIPYSNSLLEKAQSLGIPVITEVEIASIISEADIIGITGSNGKTTTTTLIYEILKQSKQRPLIAGNIGTVACEVAENAEKENCIVMELSSFQLLGTSSFRPHIAILLNLFEAHLDYHGTFAEYAQAKAKLFHNQSDQDYAIINADQEEVVRLSQDFKGRLVSFSMKSQVNFGAYILNEGIYFNSEFIISLDQIALPGKHNLENILASVCAVKLLGADNDSICEVLSRFTGVKHRLQFVEELKGRKFFNDSKATNILATKQAVTAFRDPVILLAGGLDRGNEFDSLEPFLSGVKAVITFGETASKIEKAARNSGIKLIKRVDNVEKAVPEAFALSNEGDIILLSPACASWDQYKTFEERGDMFIKSVHKLKV